MSRALRSQYRPRRSRARFLLGGFVVLFALMVVAFFTVAPIEADRRLNPVRDAAAMRAVDDSVGRVHRELFIADLHSDLLLWSRDPLERHQRGHSDVPRLLEGNVSLQVFSVVTKAPWNQNYVRTEDAMDAITLLAIAQRWPPRTWGSLQQRALYQARKLADAAARSGGRLTVIRRRADLERHLEARARNENVLAALLAMEGLHALEGDPANLDVFFDAGFRMLGLAHFFDTEVAGSAHGAERGGLTELGRDIVQRMQERGMIVDLAHASPRAIQDVLAISTRPLVVSHTGLAATCEGPRNLSDDQLRAIAATGGVVGIGFFPEAVCDDSVDGIVKAIRHGIDTVGAEHIALGSDFDGTISAPFDASRLAQLTDALLAAGISDRELRLVMGENVPRLLRATLPE